VEKLAELLQGEMSREELMDSLGLKDRMHFLNSYLKPALESGIAEMTGPEKPRSRNQRYRLTDKGRALLEQMKRKRYWPQ